MNGKRHKTVTAILAEAERHVGYRSQPERRSAFQLKHYLGRPWSGTFIDRVLYDALGDFAEVRFVSTVAALGYYINRNRVYRKPKPGDVVFFNFSTDPQQPFEQPHVGIVTEVKPDGSFETVEGETSPGTPQGSQLADGVFRRVRYPTDTIGFVRPVVRNPTVDLSSDNLVKMSYFESNPSTKAKAVETVQLALNRVNTKLSFNRGKKNGAFRSALGLFARETGTVQNRGEVTHDVLHTLSTVTGEFAVE